ncbi:MAG: zinc metallopeptidase [Bacilli bacterium]
MIYGYETPFTLLLAVVGFIIVIGAQGTITSAYNKYKKQKNKKNMTGSDVAHLILEKNGLSNIYVVETQGNLTDHYDPNRKVVKLSTEIFHGNTIAAISVAAHECGHAIQDKEGYTFMKIRSFLVPFVNFISYLGYLGLLISLFAGATGYFKVSILVILATLLFQLVTLPVEFNASSRAKEQLKKFGVTDKSEDEDVSKMLTAAAYTYVASVISSLLSLLRIVLMMNRDND